MSVNRSQTSKYNYNKTTHFVMGDNFFEQPLDLKNIENNDWSRYYTYLKYKNQHLSILQLRN